MSALDKIDKNRIPEHVAIIMDGNGRWAKKKGNKRIFGHKNGVNGVKESIEGCGKLGIKCLTLYAFSTENWNRPKLEVNSLMELLINTIHSETESLIKNDIRLHTIGQIEDLPSKARKELLSAIDATKHCKSLILNIAISYSSKVEIINAVKVISEKVKLGDIEAKDIDEELFSNHLYTKDLPNPDLMIRTSGEQRISNFLMWQLSYSELYFTDVLWPDFKKEDLYDAILDYQTRERRYGKTSDQVK